MKRALLLIGLVGILAPSAGCFRTKFVYTDRAPSAQVMDETRTYSLVGLSGPGRPLRADKMCPNGVASVEQITNIGDACITGIACGGLIYGSKTVQVTCAQGTAHNFYLDANDEVVGHEVVDPDTGEAVVEEFTSDVF